MHKPPAEGNLSDYYHKHVKVVPFSQNLLPLNVFLSSGIRKSHTGIVYVE
jgi:hypothetical protein